MIFPPPYSSIFTLSHILSVFLFLKNKKNNTTQNDENQNWRRSMIKYTQRKQNVHKKKTWSLFCVCLRLLGLGLPWSVVDIFSDTSRANQFPFSSSYQLQIASLLGVNVRVSMCPHVHVPLLVLAHNLWLKPVQACVCCHSLHEWLYISTVVSVRCCLLGVTRHCWLL